MKIQEVIQKWNAANEIDEFTKFQLAEMLDSAVQHIEQQNAAQQLLAPDEATPLAGSVEITAINGRIVGARVIPPRG